MTAVPVLQFDVQVSGIAADVVIVDPVGDAKPAYGRRRRS